MRCWYGAPALKPPSPAVRSPTRARRPASLSASYGVSQRVGQYRLPADVAGRVRAGHPWVFREALGPRGVVEPPGTVIELVSGNREFVARGYVDREHSVAVRILSRAPGTPVFPGAGTIADRFARAVQMRWVLFGGAGASQRPSAMRLFSGDSEGFPGVNVDRFGDFVVVQWLSAGAMPWRDELLDAIEATVRPAGIYEQRRTRPMSGQAAPEPAVRARGQEAPLEVVVEETGPGGVSKFGVDVTAPLGVGLFPDLRLGRAAVAAHAKDRRVLNLFSYTGAFSVAAARAGASEVVAVDLAAKSHARARRNYELSGLAPERMEGIAADAAKTLEKFASRARKFDLVVCDPPSFSQGPAGHFSVTKDLARLAELSLGVLEVGGLLAFATNSTKVSAADLDRSLAEGAAAGQAELRVVERIGLPADYPVAPGFPEGNYLKLVVAIKV